MKQILLFSLSTAISHSMAYSILEKLRLRLADRFLHAPLGDVQDHTIGEIKTVMVDKIENMEPPLAHFIPEGCGHTFDRSLIPKCLVVQVVLVLLRFLYDYLRARLQEPIGYLLTSRNRLAVGDALKRVSLGYFQQVSTGSILSSVTTGLTTLEAMGIRMVDNFVGGYLNFLVIFIFLFIINPLTAMIALAATVLSFSCMLVISHYSKINSPVAAQADRDMTSAVLEYVRGLGVVKSFGKSGAATESVKSAVSDSKKII